MVPPCISGKAKGMCNRAIAQGTSQRRGKGKTGVKLEKWAGQKRGLRVLPCRSDKTKG